MKGAVCPQKKSKKKHCLNRKFWQTVFAMKTENDFKTIEAMIKFGGSFAKNLGQAARFADLSNLDKIKVAFPEIWSQYEKMAQTISEK
jgi:uncharacterized protein YozE (UPF0346 family)